MDFLIWFCLIIEVNWMTFELKKKKHILPKKFKGRMVSVFFLLCVWLFLPSWSPASSAWLEALVLLKVSIWVLFCSHSLFFFSLSFFASVHITCWISVPQPGIYSGWLASLVAQSVKNLSAIQETWVQSLVQEDPLKKEVATHSSILAWRIPSPEEPGRLQSIGLQELDMT